MKIVGYELLDTPRMAKKAPLKVLSTDLARASELWAVEGALAGEKVGGNGLEEPGGWLFRAVSLLESGL